MGIAAPWDPVEAAEMAAAQAAEEARLQREREEEEQRKKAIAEALEKARDLLLMGKSTAFVSAMFPNFQGQIGNLVGELRSQGVQIPKR
jgi:hypothetical protein